MNIVITKATAGELNRVLELSKMFDPEEVGRAAKINDAIVAGLVWMARNEEKTIGYCLVQLFGAEHEQLPNSIFIADLFVLEEYRGQGVGSQLLKTILSSRFPTNYKSFSITHAPEEKHLTEFYKEFGFVEKGVTKAGNIKMQLLIDNHKI